MQIDNFNGLRSPIDNLVSPDTRSSPVNSPLSTSKKPKDDDLDLKHKSSVKIFANPNILITGKHNMKSQKLQCKFKDIVNSNKQKT